MSAATTTPSGPASRTAHPHHGPARPPGAASPGRARDQAPPEGAAIDEARLAQLRDDLMLQARLFEDPLAYVAGVEDALDAVRRLVSPDPIDLVDRPARML